MISRCPSCAAQVEEDAAKCASCHWDFRARIRIRPGEKPPPIGDVKPPAATPPPQVTVSQACVDLSSSIPRAPEKKSAPRVSWTSLALVAVACAAALLLLRSNSWFSRGVTIASHSPASSPVPLPAELPAPATSRQSEVAASTRPTVVILNIPSLPAAPADASGRPISPHAEPWVFEGLVYDLLSLRPVYSAKLRFLGPDGTHSGEAETAADGRYRIRLNALPAGNYRVLLTHVDYVGYLDEIDPPFFQADRASRRLAAQGRSVRPWIGSAGAVTKRTLIAIPRVLEQ